MNVNQQTIHLVSSNYYTNANITTKEAFHLLNQQYMEHFIHRICFCWGVFFISIAPAFGQACCSGGVPISSNLGLGTKESGSLQVQLTYDFNTLTDLWAVNQKLNDESRIRNTHSLLLETSYDINQAFSISGLFGLVRQERKIITQNGGEDLTINQGIGDGIFLFRYNLFHQKPDAAFQAIVGVGPKIPFGRANFTDDNGITLPADLQPGTGAWDGIIWSNLIYSGLFNPNFSIMANSTYRITTTNTRYNARQRYKFGNEFQVQLAIKQRINVGKLLLDPILSAQFRTVAPDQVDENIFSNTGGSWIYLRPGTSVSLSPNSSFRIMGDLPIYRRLEGTQLTTTYKLAISFYHTLSLKKKNRIPSLIK